MIKAGLVGATGYAGLELYKHLLRHPQVEVVFATSEQYAGRRLSAVFPQLLPREDVTLCPMADSYNQAVEVVFLSVPTGTAMQAVPRYLEQGARVVDLSADYRLNEAQTYSRWYKRQHTTPSLLDQAVYGLPELNRKQIASTSIVANPGCYPTGAILALAPLLLAKAIAGDGIVIDSKSGISGAGRSPSLKTHFVEANENMEPYNIGRSHRHVGEIDQELSKLYGATCSVLFSPHLAPMNRGILSTIYVRLKEVVTEQDLYTLYETHYGAEPFVRILRTTLPQTAAVAHTNFCHIGLKRVEDSPHAILVSAIDNLVKGAAGQAVQNMNVMFGCDETVGLI